MATLLARGSLPTNSSTTGKHGTRAGTILTLVVCTLAALTLLTVSVRYGITAEPVLEPVAAASE
ncbi:hypothetical protein [Methylobacterium gnaphalii]|uniref:Uncharacterized protein n=1 Tax=Methylobacterium gnaphalii TaxID=1010610 RepID=A0A512JJX0_9HYPH|nr:hypothetical protein [Methylobacterium gnaphalii]GEP10255.1 hypothetical protein MGN01_21000 [Methylobacterium gnaphalii]GJD68610.1 hypothetical protein MMMDOFMJ_1534 [Methylobacterium gnaphalii]GLS50556.1 hypothetical protein GCM10007885_34080 [Methylobacterium gnaphalii]